METLLLYILDFSEFLIPIIFFAFTHFVDEKIHSHWENANYHPSRWIRFIHRYQWEACFLVISLLAILGVKIAHRGEEFFLAGLIVFCIAFAFIGGLFLLAISILNNEDQKMNASVFYLALLVYVLYVSLDIYFIKIDRFVLFTIASTPVYKPFIFLPSFLLFLVLYWVCRKHISPQLYAPVLKAGDVSANIRVYTNQQTSNVKRKEALYYILKHYKEVKNTEKLKEWIKKGQQDLPGKVELILKHLKL